MMVRKGRFLLQKVKISNPLPVPPDQLPSQRMGEITKIISAGNLFNGYGAELLAMALVLPGGIPAPAVASPAGQAENQEMLQYSKPLTAAELESFYSNDHQPLSETGSSPVPLLDQQQAQSLNADFFNWVFGNQTGGVLDRYLGYVETEPDSAVSFNDCQK